MLIKMSTAVLLLILFGVGKSKEKVRYPDFPFLLLTIHNRLQILNSMEIVFKSHLLAACKINFNKVFHYTRMS